MEDVTYELKYLQCVEQMKHKPCTRTIMQNASERGACC